MNTATKKVPISASSEHVRVRSAPKRGIRTHPLPMEKSHLNPVWLFVVILVAVLYMVLIFQHMTLTELSLEASGYRKTIVSCEEEISKMKKDSLSEIIEEELDAFIRRYDMNKICRSDVEYLNSDAEEVIISYNVHTSEIGNQYRNFRNNCEEVLNPFLAIVREYFL